MNRSLPAFGFSIFKVSNNKATNYFLIPCSNKRVLHHWNRITSCCQNDHQIRKNHPKMPGTFTGDIYERSLILHSGPRYYKCRIQAIQFIFRFRVPRFAYFIPENLKTAIVFYIHVPGSANCVIHPLEHESCICPSYPGSGFRELRISSLRTGKLNPLLFRPQNIGKSSLKCQLLSFSGSVTFHFFFLILTMGQAISPTVCNRPLSSSPNVR